MKPTGILTAALLCALSSISHAKPIKVFILAGQSNMEGQGSVDHDDERDSNGGKGNLVWSMKHSKSAEKMKKLKNEKGEWVVRDDVQISFKVGGDKILKGGLSVGYTGYGADGSRRHIGPELGFGFVMGDFYQEPVLLIKTAWGGKSLFVDFRPPSSGGKVGPCYTQMVQEVRAALADLGDQKYEIAGFYWQQGWNDMCEAPAIAEYAQNLVNLVSDLRKEFKAPNMPVVVGELGNDGPVTEGAMFEFRKAQEEGTKRIKNALFIKTTDFARPAELSPCPTHGHHWYANAESYFLIGEAAGEGMKRLSAITKAVAQDKNLPISGTYGTTPTPPPVTNDAPAAGKRVRVTTPGSGYEGNPKVYHTLYLPPEWVPGQKYPVIIEYGGNGWTVEANKLGYYQSAGTGYIWVSMPNIDQNSTLGDKSDDFNTTSWWGSEGQNEVGAADDAAYAMATVIDLIEKYGGDHSAVFVTGFSRGAVACGNLGLLNDAMADIWVGFLPHSHHDAWFDNGTRTDRVKGRASFITYGQNDGGGGNSRKGVDWLNARGFPVESYELAGTGHTDEWITDASAPLASSLSYTGHPLVSDVRARMRTWMSEVITNKPGTSRISGVVTDASGAPIAGVRVQSGLTHWTFTDASGAYKLAGLLVGARSVTVSHPSHRWSPDTLNVTLAGTDLTGRNFQATTAFP